MTRWTKESYRTGQHSLSRSEVQRVVEATRSFSEMTLIKLAVASGIRRGDIVRLKWDDLDFDTGRLSFYERKKRRNRSVYLPPNVLGDLERLRKSQNKGIYIFPGRSEPKYGVGHLSDRHAYNILNMACENAGLEQRPFHALRATCIKLSQESGWSMSQTAEHVGDTVRVIEHHYMAPSDGEMRKTALERPIV